MEQSKIDYTVLRVWRRVDRGDCWQYVRSARMAHEISYSDRVTDAMLLDLESPQEIINFYDLVAGTLKPSQRIELVKVTVTHDVELVDINDGPILEERRRQALSKLNRADIDALGLGKLASYSKLKYHGDDNG